MRDPTDRFLDALDAWLAEDTPDTRQSLQHAADELLRAWNRAADHFRAIRPPGSCPTTTDPADAYEASP